MLKSQGCRRFLLLSLLAGLYSVNGNVSKRGCLGDSIKIIDNISYNSNDIVVTIYMNGDSKFILGMWHIQDGVPAIKNGQSDRLVLDKKGNIWILNLIISDDAKYTIKIDVGNSSTIYNATLEVMAAPTKNCKPNIISTGKSLFAELKTVECGRPPASAYWLENPGISISRQVIELQPGNENGIYHACIEGDSLICAKISNFSEHCSFYNKSEPNPLINQSIVVGTTARNLPTTDIPRASSEPSTITIIICVMVAICLILLIAKRMKNLYESCKTGRGIGKHRNGHDDTELKNTTEEGVPTPKISESLQSCSSTTNPPAGRGIGPHGNGLDDTELKNTTEEGENQPLILHSDADRSSLRRSLDSSSPQEERSETVFKHPVHDKSTCEGKGTTTVDKEELQDASPLAEERSEAVGKHPIQDFPDQYVNQERSETVGKYPVKGAVPKSTGTRPKSITPLPPEKL